MSHCEHCKPARPAPRSRDRDEDLERFLSTWATKNGFVTGDPSRRDGEFWTIEMLPAPATGTYRHLPIRRHDP
jgi:hypothetical protein